MPNSSTTDSGGAVPGLHRAGARPGCVRVAAATGLDHHGGDAPATPGLRWCSASQ